MSEYAMLNLRSDAHNGFVVTANGAINLNSATIKWKDQITKCFIEKKTQNKLKTRERDTNMIALAWIEWPD